jgi:hypothetical protein
MVPGGPGKKFSIYKVRSVAELAARARYKYPGVPHMDHI